MSMSIGSVKMTVTLQFELTSESHHFVDQFADDGLEMTPQNIVDATVANIDPSEIDGIFGRIGAFTAAATLIPSPDDKTV